MKFFWIALVMLGSVAVPALAEPDAALLLPSSMLSPETLAAARYDWKKAGLGFVGVWAHDAKSCAFIDSATPYDGYRINMPESLDSYGSFCKIKSIKKVGDVYTIMGTCEDEGYFSEEVMGYHVLDDEHLGEDDLAEKMVRCHLPD